MLWNDNQFPNIPSILQDLSVQQLRFSVSWAKKKTVNSDRGDKIRWLMIWWFGHGSKSINPQNDDWNTKLPKHDCISNSERCDLRCVVVTATFYPHWITIFFHSPPPILGSTFEQGFFPKKTEVEKPKPRGQNHWNISFLQQFFSVQRAESVSVGPGPARTGAGRVQQRLGCLMA